MNMTFTITNIKESDNTPKPICGLLARIITLDITVTATYT